jgi:hypothetical protein
MKTKILLIVAACILHCGYVAAQNEERIETFYMGIEMGAAKDYRNFVQMSASLQSDRDYYRLRIAVASDDKFVVQKEGDRESWTGPKEKGLADLGFIYGLNIPFFKHHLQLGSGISFVQRFEPDKIYNDSKQAGDDYRFITRKAVGLPIEIKYGFRFYKSLEAIGSINSNINKLKSYTGFL